MNCPTCGLDLGSTPPDTCPRCGRPLRTDMPPNPYAQTPSMEPQQPMGQQPMPNPYEQPPAAGGYGQAPPDYGQVPPNYGQIPPNYGQMPAPGYGQMPPPTPYGQQTTQNYPPPYGGQPPQPGGPAYGQGGPPLPGAPASPWPVAGGGPAVGSPFKPARRGAGGVAVRIVAAVIVLAVIVVGGLIYNAAKGDTVYSSALTNVSDWPDTGGCMPESDGYHITAGVLCYAPPDSLNDVTLTVTVKQLSGDAGQPYGVVFRRVSQGNYYLLDINSNGEWGFGKAVSGSASFVVEPSTNAAIHTGLNASNTLEVMAKGSHFTFFVNGTQVGQGDDSTYAAGKWGLESSDNIEVVFNDLSIKNTK